MSVKQTALECDFLEYPIQAQGELKYGEKSDLKKFIDSCSEDSTSMSCNHDSELQPLQTNSQPSSSDRSETSDQSFSCLDLSRHASDCSNNFMMTESNSSVESDIRRVPSAQSDSSHLAPKRQLAAEERREKHRISQRQRRINELPWERTKRLQRSAERQRLKRLNLTEAEKQRAKELAKKRTKERRARETEEEKEIRRIRDRMRMREKRALIKQVRVLGAEVVAQTCVRLLNPPAVPTAQLHPPQNTASFGTVDLSNVVLTSDILLPISAPSSEVSTPSDSSDQNSAQCSVDELASRSQCPTDTSTTQTPSSTSALYAVAKDYLATEHEKYLKQKERQKLRCRERRANESPEQRAVRLHKAAERQRLKRMSLTEQEKLLYNEVNRVRAKKRRSEESPQQQESRRTSERLRRREQRALARQRQEAGQGPPTFVNGLNHPEEPLTGDFTQKTAFTDPEFILF